MRITPRNIDQPAFSRKELARGIANTIGANLVYNGMPTCSYSAGQYTIERDGSIVGDDWNPIREFLIQNGYADAADLRAEREEQTETAPAEVESEADANAPTRETDLDLGAVRQGSNQIDQVDIGIPVPDMTVLALKNLLFMLYTKQYLLNRAFGKELLSISEGFIARIQERNPESMDEFEMIIKDAISLDLLEGVSFDAGSLHMAFPFEPDDPQSWELYTQFMKLLIKCALGTKRTAPILQKPDNERYYMHSWLIRLGCGGSDFKALRRRMLRNLKGYCAFPDEARAQKHKDKYRELRRIRREIDEEANRR